MKFFGSSYLSRLGAVLILIGLLIGGQSPTPAWAYPADPQSAQPLTLDSVRVQIWPEYDKPSALVIYNVTLPSTATLPAAMTLRIPAAAGKPAAVAWQSPDKALYEINYDTNTAGNWIQVNFSTPAPTFRIEYYDTTLTKNGAQRSFTFSWPGDYAVQNLSLEIQQPVNASAMSFTPSAGPGQVSSSDGLTYYNLLAGKVNAGTTFDLAMTYTKPDDTLTSPSQFQPATARQPVTANTAGRVTLDQMLPWIIGGLGLLLIATGFLWYYRTGLVSASPQPSRPRHSRSAADPGGSAAQTASAASATENSGTTFCTQCGKRAAPGDTFCRACGTRLK